MNDRLLVGFAEGLAEAGVGCLRFNFPYIQRRRSSPDRPEVLIRTWRAAFDFGSQFGGPIWAGGKSMGGRIASMAAAEGMPAAGLVFLGYPLHPPGRPERIRDAHLYEIRVPMLFIQGTRDNFARMDLLEPVLGKLGRKATLHTLDGGDHSFRLRGSKVDDSIVGGELAPIAARFVLEHGR